MRTWVCAAALFGIASIAGCHGAPGTTGGSAQPSAAPLFEGMGSHHRAITTSSPEAQRYFDQGLTWAYAFNHDEAERSFRRAAELDPDAAMPHWGIALVNGPHINNPTMDDARSRTAWDALTQARARTGGASPVERDLIEALGARYADPARGPIPVSFQDRAPLDQAYARAMAGVAARHPGDADVATLYAEALMDLRPWDLWDLDGNPRPETPAVLRVLESTLRADPDHPGANHLYIHAVEASREPGRAARAADTLRTLVPASGHLVHMPSHIDVRTGRWAEAAEQNRRASAADEAYRELSPRQGFYRLYMAHDDHFLSYACMMLGRREESLRAARDMLRKIPPDFARANAPMVDAYAMIEVEALVRFGDWEGVLALPEPPADLPITRAFWRFGRATSLGALGRQAEARREQVAFRAAVAAVPEGAMMAMNPAYEVLAIADDVLEGELAWRDGRTDDAVGHLRSASAREDRLRYMEPPDWIQPTRHSLGAVLLAAGRIGEAEQVYRDDLERWPENGWSLYGLSRCLEASGSPEAPGVAERFRVAWAHADTPLRATCLCVERAD